MTTQEVGDSTAQRVADLTVAEFRELIYEVVVECFGEMYEDFHPDAELTAEFAGKLKASIDARTHGEPTILAEEVYRRLRLD
jgi:hypothetical protein